MSKIEMGTGFKVLTYFLALMIVVGGSVYVGTELQKAKQVEANVEVMSVDSKVAQSIRVETKIEKARVDEAFKNIDSMDGDLTAGELQLLQSAITTSVERTNPNSLVRAITRQ